MMVMVGLHTCTRPSVESAGKCVFIQIVCQANSCTCRTVQHQRRTEFLLGGITPIVRERSRMETKITQTVVGRPPQWAPTNSGKVKPAVAKALEEALNSGLAELASPQVRISVKPPSAVKLPVNVSKVVAKRGLLARHRSGEDVGYKHARRPKQASTSLQGGSHRNSLHGYGDFVICT